MTTCLKVRRSTDGPTEDVFADGPASRWVDAKGHVLWDPYNGWLHWIRINDEILYLETAVDVPEESNP